MLKKKTMALNRRSLYRLGWYLTVATRCAQFRLAPVHNGSHARARHRGDAIFTLIDAVMLNHCR
jgi:hypothetical protein